MTQGIYKIEDQKGKIYVGSSIRIEIRWSEHRRALNEGTHSNNKLQNAWNKYGAEYFTFSIIEIIEDSSKLLIQEQKYLNIIFTYYKSSQHYNILRIAGSPLGIKRSIETKARMSAKKLGNDYRAKVYRFTAPDGTITDITNMRRFCRDNNLDSGNMIKVALGRFSQHKGWKLYNE